jgi:hypothetical protein
MTTKIHGDAPGGIFFKEQCDDPSRISRGEEVARLDALGELVSLLSSMPG